MIEVTILYWSDQKWHIYYIGVTILYRSNKEIKTTTNGETWKFASATADKIELEGQVRCFFFLYTLSQFFFSARAPVWYWQIFGLVSYAISTCCTETSIFFPQSGKLFVSFSYDLSSVLWQSSSWLSQCFVQRRTAEHHR